MRGLAIDSADRTASAALWSDADPNAGGGAFALLSREALPPEAGKADQLITVIERLLADQDLAYRDLDVIAVNRGPGSFTGIRSAVALGRGLALAGSIPVLGVSSHEALLTSLDIDGGWRAMIALDARRGEVYVQAFGSDGRASCDIMAKTPAAAAADMAAGRWYLAGSGAGLVHDAIRKGPAADVRLRVIETSPVDAGRVARAAAMRLAAGEAPSPGFELRPLYIRAPDAVPPAPLIRATASGKCHGASQVTV